MLAIAAWGRADVAADHSQGGLRPIRATSLPGPLETYAALSVKHDTIWLVQPDSNRIVEIRAGRASSRPLRCGELAAPVLRGAWWSAHEGAAVLAVGDTVWRCHLGRGGAERLGVLPAMVSVLFGYDGNAVAATWLTSRMEVVAGLLSSTGRLAPMVSLSATAPDLLQPLPGSTAASPFVPVTVAGSRLVAANPVTYDLAVFGPDGRVERRIRREGLDTLVFSEEEKERLRARLGATPQARAVLEQRLRVAKPYFRRETLAGDRLGRIWVATGFGHPDSTGVDVYGPGEQVRRLWIPGEAQRIAVHGGRLAVLARRRTVGGWETVLQEFAVP